MILFEYNKNFFSRINGNLQGLSLIEYIKIQFPMLIIIFTFFLEYPIFLHALMENLPFSAEKINIFQKKFILNSYRLNKAFSLFFPRVYISLWVSKSVSKLISMQPSDCSFNDGIHSLVNSTVNHRVIC